MQAYLRPLLQNRSIGCKGHTLRTDSIVTNSDYANDFSADNLSPKFAATYNFNDNLINIFFINF